MAIRALRALQQYILREVLKDEPKGVMQTLPNKDLLELSVQVLAQRLMQGGIDPTTLKNANQVENAIKIVESRPAVQEGITATKSAKVFDLKGKEIKDTRNIMGGEELKETDEAIKAKLDKGNKEGIARIRERQKMLDDAIDNQSPSLSGDTRTDAVLVAEDLAERMGLVYDDLPIREQTKLYDQAYQGLSKMRFEARQTPKGAPPKIPSKKDADSQESSYDDGPADFDPDADNETFAQGGRAGFSNGGIDVLKIEDEALQRALKAFKYYQRMDGKKNFRDYLRQAGERGDQFRAEGGRIGFKDGMTRRTFLKLLGGMAAVPIVGKFFKLAKVGKTMKEVPMIKTDDVAGKPEWFDALVNKVITEGDDVTKRFATGERQSIHQKTLDDGSVVRVTEDVDDGAVRVEYESDKNVFEDPVQLQYRKPKPDEGDPRPTAEFTTAESGPVGRRSGPDDFDIEVDEVGGTSIRDLDSDVSKLKEYATGKKPTMTEILQNKKRRDKARAITEGGDEMIDAVTRRQGDYDPLASGGIARMLGE